MTVKRDNEVGGPLGVEPGPESVEFDDAYDQLALAVATPDADRAPVRRDVRVHGRGRLNGGPERSHSLVDCGAVLDGKRKNPLGRRGRQHLAGPCPLHDRGRQFLASSGNLDELTKQQAFGPEGVVHRLHSDSRVGGDLLHRCGGVPLLHKEFLRRGQHAATGSQRTPGTADDGALD